jgi:hypothetical protein
MIKGFTNHAFPQGLLIENVSSSRALRIRVFGIPVEEIQGTRNSPTQIVIPKISFDTEGVVVELDTERPVVPRGSRPLKELVVGSYEQENSI